MSRYASPEAPGKGPSPDTFQSPDIGSQGRDSALKMSHLVGSPTSSSKMSPSRSRLLMSSEEKKRLEQERMDELTRELREMEESGKFSEEEITRFKKNYLVKRSLDEIRQRAKELDTIRHSPQRY